MNGTGIEYKNKMDGYLNEIKLLSADLNRLESSMKKEMQAVTDIYQPSIDGMKAALTQKEKALKSCVRSARGALFSETDTLRLKNGVVMLKTARWITRRSKNVLGNLLRMGLRQFVRENPQVDWDALETASDDLLNRIGTERVNRIDIQWEVK